MAFYLFLLTVFFWATSALATASTYTQQNCFTSRASIKPASIKTISLSNTLYVPAYKKSTQTPSTTVTPVQSTSTKTSYVIKTITATASQMTDTFTSTSTTILFVTSSSTSTVTVVATAPTTTITSTDTTTVVPTSPGFTPVSSVVPAPTPQKVKRIAISERRNAKPDIAERAAANAPAKVLKLNSPMSGYPSAVTCKATIKIISTTTLVYTARTTRTVTAPTRIVTSQYTSTLKVTSTSVPADASSVSTVLTSTTITQSLIFVQTSTTTTTPTQSISVPGPTTYAQCSPNNILNSINGAGIDSVTYEAQVYTYQTSALDCCNACATYQGCTGSLYWASQNACSILLRNDGVQICDGSQLLESFLTSVYQDPSDGYTISNGQCGQYAYNGPDPDF